jgi:hypothetical protein
MEGVSDLMCLSEKFVLEVIWLWSFDHVTFLKNGGGGLEVM